MESLYLEFNLSRPTQYSMINRDLKEEVKRNLYIGRLRLAPPYYHPRSWYAHIPMEPVHVFYLQPRLLGNRFINLLWSDNSRGVARSSDSGVRQTLIKASARPLSALTAKASSFTSPASVCSYTKYGITSPGPREGRMRSFPTHSSQNAEKIHSGVTIWDGRN